MSDNGNEQNHLQNLIDLEQLCNSVLRNQRQREQQQQQQNNKYIYFKILILPLHIQLIQLS